MLVAPLFSENQGHFLAFCFTVTYVGSLYLSKNARLSFVAWSTHVPEGTSRQRQLNERWRDDADVIRARIIAVSLATGASCFLIFQMLWPLYGFYAGVHVTFFRLGFIFSHPIKAHLVTPLIFVGPFYCRYLYEVLPFQRHWNTESTIKKVVSLPGLRNYLVAPYTEEVVFRACILSIYHLSGISRLRMIVLAPLWFSLAHFHHAWDLYNRCGRTWVAAKHASMAISFQLLYTSFFGSHCAYLFLRTGSIFPAITSHIFCNFMGVPHLPLELVVFPERRKAIFGTYALGVLAYVFGMIQWTNSSDSLYWRPPRSLL
ncbi:hypothetical protein ARMSODRAFT_1090493 [Armillaria solidipes]|uniref:intramembrane prenyl-peptidase Rce1 n=1 Tax=Armillaria solidipes TaxID=1076256 RepID=A0A2H3AMX4_9AGAR|nr:hypothetical protein ARMSODRAFT_1090493 [Armillaria solidipes]